jgi:hypothetical protein
MKIAQVLQNIANEFPIDTGATNQTFITYAANESRFVEANFSEPLTIYATGWRDPEDVEGLLEFIAPKVQTGRRFEYAQASNVEEFLSEADDVRAIGASFKRIEYTSKKATDKTLNKGLTIRVDIDNVEDQPNWREVYTGRIMRRLFRNEYRRAVALVSAAATNTAKTWDTTAGKDPDQDMIQVLTNGQDLSGIYGNRILYGHTAWNKRKLCYGAQNTPAGYGNRAMTEAEIAGWIGVDDVKVSRARYSSTAAARTQVISNLVLSYIAETGATPEDPSNIKRFVSPTEGGTPFRVYEQQISSHLIDITVEHYSNVLITSTLGIQQVTVT